MHTLYQLDVFHQYMVPIKTICMAAIVDDRAQYVIWISLYCFGNEDCKQQFKHAQNGL